jgi:hypothetical protein
VKLKLHGWYKMMHVSNKTWHIIKVTSVFERFYGFYELHHGVNPYYQKDSLDLWENIRPLTRMEQLLYIDE